MKLENVGSGVLELGRWVLQLQSLHASTPGGVDVAVTRRNGSTCCAWLGMSHLQGSGSGRRHGGTSTGLVRVGAGSWHGQ